ncbi:hypothetical protein [Nonomuraea jabiensis]|uniref:hypothetical protein n=1 Tax=Nonomuraea jabiensis TaxID=882448 RepID=UPI003D720AAE
MTQTLPPRTDTRDELREHVSTRPAQTLVRAAARGAIGSMAMSGLRQFTTAVGLVAKVPPEAVLERTVPRLFRRVHHRRRPAMVELTHWGYGTAGGALYGLLPHALRRHPWAGPAYGVAFWLAFETAIAPALGLPRHPRTTMERLALLADHVLYGVVVGASPWPHRDVPESPVERPMH